MAATTLIRTDAPSPTDQECRARHLKLRAEVAAALGEGAVASLAEPRSDTEGGGIAWYSGRTGPVLPAARLPAAEASRLREKLEGELAPIMQWARGAVGAPDPTRAEAARLVLALADEVDLLNVYEVGGAPVLVARNDGEIAFEHREQQVLVNRMVPIDIFVAARPLWVAVVLGAGLLALGVATAQTMVGILPLRTAAPALESAGIPLRTAPMSELETARARESVLRARLDELLAQLGDRRQSCPPVPTTAPQPRPLLRRQKRTARRVQR